MNKDKSEATARPWKWEPTWPEGTVGFSIKSEKREGMLCGLNCSDHLQRFTIDEARANARLIVRAVNAHDRLVGFIERLEDYLYRSPASDVENGPTMQWWRDVFGVEARTILAELDSAKREEG